MYTPERWCKRIGLKRTGMVGGLVEILVVGDVHYDGYGYWIDAVGGVTMVMMEGMLVCLTCHRHSRLIQCNRKASMAVN